MQSRSSDWCPFIIITSQSVIILAESSKRYLCATELPLWVYNASLLCCRRECVTAASDMLHTNVIIACSLAREGSLHCDI